MRSVEQGDGVFGPASELIRAEALIRPDLPPPLGPGLLPLGSREAHAFESGHGSELLAFLGGVVFRAISRRLLDCTSANRRASTPPPRAGRRGPAPTAPGPTTP